MTYVDTEYVDENNVYHYVTTYTCEVCNIEFIVDRHYEKLGCDKFEKGTVTLNAGGTTVFEWSYSHYYSTKHSYDYEFIFDDEENPRCISGVTIIGTCRNCGETFRSHEIDHMSVEVAYIDFTDYGSRGGSLSIYSCPCGYYSNYNFYSCPNGKGYSSVYDDENGIRHEVYTNVCDDNCNMTFVRDYYYVQEGCKTFRVGTVRLSFGDTLIGEWSYRHHSGYSHDYEATYEFLDPENPNCESGVNTTYTCTRCGEYYNSHSYSHNANTVEHINLSDYGIADGYMLIEECLCGYYRYYMFSPCGHSNGEHTYYGDDNKVLHTVYTYICDECDLEFQSDSCEILEGCDVFQVGSLILKSGSETIKEYEFRRKVNVEHDYVYTFEFANPESPNCEDGLLVSYECTRCGITGNYQTTGHSGFSTGEYRFVELGGTTGYFETFECPCGYYKSFSWSYCEHTSYSTNEYVDESGIRHYVKLYHCTECNISLNMDHHYEDEGCQRFAVGTATLKCGDTVITEYNFKYFYGEYHTYDNTFRFADPENPDCESGVYVTYSCRYCDYSYDRYYSYHINNLVETIDLTTYGACEGTLSLYACPCEKNKSFNINGCLNNYSSTSNQYVDENGVTQYVETRYCSDCGLRYDRTYYYVDNGDCTRDVHYTHVASINQTLISLYKTTSVDTIHDYEVTAELVEGATNCEEGVVATYKCRDCGYSYTNRYSWHDVNIEERIDLSTYGAACGGYLTLKSCVCGYSFSYSFDGAECDFDQKSTAGWIENTIYGSQETAEGSSWFDSYYRIYTCSVTYPEQCGFAIRMSRHWLKNDDCSATQYYVFQLGYDESTGEYLDEIVISTATRTYHNYVYESFTNGNRYTCSDCGSYYEYKDFYNDSGYHYKSEQIFVNTLDDGCAKYRENINEYLGYSDSRFGNYHKSSFNKTIYANGDESWNRWDYEYKDYTAPFGEDSFIHIEHFTSSSGDDYAYERAYTYYRGYQFEIYDHHTNGSYFSNDDYTYDFTESCTRTLVHTNSNGYTYTSTESCHPTSHHVTDKSSTCTQFGEYHYECVLCKEVTGRYTSHPTAHNWIKIPSGIYYCYDCGLQNENGASGSIVMEDMTKKYGNGENYVLGYWMRTFVQFTPYASVVFNTPVVDPTTGLEMTEMILFGFNPDQFHYESDEYVGIYVSKAYFEELAAATLADWGIEATRDMYDFKITFVPDGADSNFVYGMTFSDLLHEAEVDYIIKEDEFFTHYLSEGEHKDFTVMSEETSEWVFESFTNQDSYVELYDSEGNLITGDDDGGENTNFRLTYTLEAGVSYTVRVRWLNGGTYGNMGICFDKQ